MTSYERVMAALDLKEPDRVPIAENVINARVFKALMPSAEYQSDFEVEFGLDVLWCNAEYAEIWREGPLYKDEWNILYKDTPEDCAHPMRGPLQDGQLDLSAFEVPPIDGEGRMGRLPYLVENFKKDKAIAFWIRPFFLWAIYLVGFEDLMMYMHTEPEFIHDLFDKILEGQIEVAETAIDMGADIIVDTDDYAFNMGPFFSLEMFEEFIFPRMKKFNAAVHAKGVKMIKHTDGNCMDLIPGFIETGIDGLHSIEPSAGMDLGVVKKMYGDRLSLWGNVDCGALMSNGTPDEVEEAVKQCLRDGAPGGGYILHTSNSIVSDCKPENYKRMLDIGKKYGAYPINV